MKRILILVITTILTVSFMGCNDNLKSESTRNDDESKSVSSDVNNTSSDTESKNGEDANNSESESNSKIVDQKIAVEDATDIEIAVSIADVTIKAYDGDEVKVTGKLSENSNGIDLNKSGNKIKMIEKSKTITKLFNVRKQDEISKLDILIPSRLNGKFELEQGVGTVSVDGMSFKNINITGGTGDFKCNDIVFDKLNFISGVGNAAINLNKKCGDMTIDGGVGDLKIEMSEIGGNITYKGGVGNLDIKIPENSPIKFEKNKGVGDCKINAKTSDEGAYTFNLKIGVGSINIHN